MYRLFLYSCLLLYCVICNSSYAQVVQDSASKVNVSIEKDSIKKYQHVVLAKNKKEPLVFFLTEQHIIKEKEQDKTVWFYLLAILTLSFSLLQLLFYRYFKALYSFIFQPPLKQRYLREQMLQNPQASLLLNIFFILSVGIYMYTVLEFYSIRIYNTPWISSLMYSAIIMSIYVGKYFFLHIIGWIFHIKEVASAYIFIIFSINKIVGLVLLPINIALVFMQHYLTNTIVLFSFILLLLLLLYRYIISYNIIRSSIVINRLHFFIYLCAFEAVPLLIVYKVLSKFVNSYS